MSANIYLDVDGVINAVALDKPSWGWPDSAQIETVNGFQIMYSPLLVARINALAERPEVEMHWLTTWEHDAPQMLCPVLGINGGHWPVIGTEQHYEKELVGDWWKLAALRDHLPSGSRAVWIDDDIEWDKGADEWLAKNPNVRAICPRTINGITPKQMTLIEEWVR